MADPQRQLQYILKLVSANMKKEIDDKFVSYTQFGHWGRIFWTIISWSLYAMS